MSSTDVKSEVVEHHEISSDEDDTGVNVELTEDQRKVAEAAGIAVDKMHKQSRSEKKVCFAYFNFVIFTLLLGS